MGTLGYATGRYLRNEWPLSAHFYVEVACRPKRRISLPRSIEDYEDSPAMPRFAHQKATEGTTSDCRTGVSPVPRIGSLGIKSR